MPALAPGRSSDFRDGPRASIARAGVSTCADIAQVNPFLTETDDLYRNVPSDSSITRDGTYCFRQPPTLKSIPRVFRPPFRAPPPSSFFYVRLIYSAGYLLYAPRRFSFLPLKEDRNGR